MVAGFLCNNLQPAQRILVARLLEYGLLVYRAPRQEQADAALADEEEADCTQDEDQVADATTLLSYNFV